MKEREGQRDAFIMRQILLSEGYMPGQTTQRPIPFESFLIQCSDTALYSTGSH